ncbi:MAG: hypothetical protein PXX73_07505 [Sideroxydans sp.]|nr:hypothetical protein [Sideroxydans sp.]
MPTAKRTALYLIAVVAIAIALFALYISIALHWSYSEGERAGFVQKLSKKGWLCKTWEGELALVSLPGAAPEKFIFTVRDDAVAERINKQVGTRVALVYAQHKGLPTSCFGDTDYFVEDIKTIQP